MKITGQRPQSNEELYKLLDGPDAVKYIKFRTVKWASHRVWVDDTRMVPSNTPTKTERKHVMEEDPWEDHD